ncbi:MAG TPA: phospholipase D-like domain-containing protein, partial [Leptospiraceae bacterium]|nr:phospholipase D-like domain-containing protein [Leptospiraceae bacterium]
MKKDILYLESPWKRIHAFQGLIQKAEKNIILQMYLFSGNGELATLKPVENVFPWAHTVASLLSEKKKNFPNMNILVILDTQTVENPERTFKKKYPLARHILEEAGISVVSASLKETFYNEKRSFPESAAFHRNWSNERNGKLFSKQEWAYRQNIWQTLQNTEDHRKNIVIDSGKVGIMFSHNIIDQAYHWNENTFLLRGKHSHDLWRLALDSAENAFSLPVAFSEEDIRIKEWILQEKAEFKLHKNNDDKKNYFSEDRNGNRILSSGPEIHREILNEIRNAEKNGVTEILAASAYFSDPLTLNELRKAGEKCKVRILTDNCHALPLNFILRVILRNTVNLFCIDSCRRSERVTLRLFPSSPKEMMHCKAIAFLGRERKLIAGQANFTPNSFSGAWLETSIYIKDEKIINQFINQFEKLWNRS